MIFQIKKFEKSINVTFKDKSLLLKALTHKSANQDNNNEKLEFLGDRVIGLILSNKLFNIYPKETEGVLDKRFAKLVNRKTCASIAWSIGIKDFIIIGDVKKKISRKDEKILSDACEAIIGAVFVDRGYNYVKEFVLRLWKQDINKSHITILDPKTKLQEHSLKMYKKLPVYRLLSSKGPKHNPIFKISVIIDGSKQFIGLGNSKKQAQQDGANNLLKSININ